MSADAHQLRDLGREMARATTAVGADGAAVFRKTVFDIEADAKIGAPVDTGDLQNSISSEIEGDGRHTEMTAEIGPTAEHGIYQELGTSVMAAQPYLGPAFDRRIGPFTEAIGKLGGRLL